MINNRIKLRLSPIYHSLIGFRRKFRSETPGMDIKHAVGAKIKTLRKVRGMTQPDLANAIDRSIDALSNLERGLSLPNFETLERLSGALDVPVKEFFPAGEQEEID